MPRWNGKPDLIAIQLQERKRRRMMMRRGMFGMPNSKGTMPRQFTGTSEPVFKPMPRLGFSFDLIWQFFSFLPWLRRRRREAELAQEQKSQSMKAKRRV